MKNFHRVVMFAFSAVASVLAITDMIVSYQSRMLHRDFTGSFFAIHYPFPTFCFIVSHIIYTLYLLFSKKHYWSMQQHRLILLINVGAGTYLAFSYFTHIFYLLAQ